MLLSALHVQSLPAAQGIRRQQASLSGMRYAPAAKRVTTAKMGGSFDEGADRVRQLLGRDKKEVSQYGDIGGSLSAEFDEGTSAEWDEPEATTTSTPAAPARNTGTTPAKPTSPFGAAPAASSPFGAAPAASPFGGTAAPRTNKPLFEPEGLRPDLPALPVDTTPWWKKITLTQVVLVFTFSSIILLMLATFAVVLQSGGVRFNED